MNTKWMALLLALAVIGLNGCATMSGDECATVDWHTVGFEDGASGYGSNRLGDRRKACAKHGVTLDFAAYQAGREQGLEHFCQPSRGFNIGTNGGSYNGVCAANSEGDFLDAYNAGHHLYNLRSRVNTANQQIDRKRQAMENNEELMKDKGIALIAAETSTEDRIRIVADLKDLAQTNGMLEADIEQLLDERAHNKHELAAYEVSLAASAY